MRRREERVMEHLEAFSRCVVAMRVNANAKRGSLVYKFRLATDEVNSVRDGVSFLLSAEGNSLVEKWYREGMEEAVEASDTSKVGRRKKRKNVEEDVLGKWRQVARRCGIVAGHG